MCGYGKKLDSSVIDFASQGFYRAFHRAASTQEKMCPSHPSQISHNNPVIKKWNSAARTRPCSNWPSPGIKKLASAAITLPLEP
jgi:hypothetical protein